MVLLYLYRSHIVTRLVVCLPGSTNNQGREEVYAESLQKVLSLVSPGFLSHSLSLVSPAVLSRAASERVVPAGFREP